MDGLGHKAFLEASESFLGSALSKHTLDKGKAVDENILTKLPSSALALGMAEQPQKDLGADLYKGKTPIELNPIKQEPEPYFNLLQHPKKDQVGESSNVVPTQAPPSRPPILCKYCDKQFSSTQALGGHQNAHKQEREMQKFISAAQELGKNPFIFNLLGITPRLFPGSFCGYNFQNPNFASKEWQARPDAANLGLGSPSVGQTPEGYVVPSPMRPTGTAYNSEWPKPLGQGLGSGNRSQGSANFDGSFNMFLQARSNEARPNKKQCIENMGVDQSHESNEPTEKEKSEKENESTDTDLTLKL